MGTQATCSVDGCDRPARKLGYCGGHYERQRSTGSVQAHKPLRRRRHGWTDEARYHDDVDQHGPDDCWPWRSDTNRRGYGTFNHSSGLRLAHRYGWELANGPIPDGLFVCHHCDNPPCQNPSHLFLGTPKDNAVDMSLKGRGPRGKARLTREQAWEIKRRCLAGESRHALAAEFCVSATHVWQIAAGRRWGRA